MMTDLWCTQEMNTFTICTACKSHVWFIEIHRYDVECMHSNCGLCI